MAKKSKIAKDKKIRRKVANQAQSRAKLKKIANDKSLSNEERFDAMSKLDKKSKNSSKVRIHNRCSLTGRPHAYYRYFKMSRIMLRELALSGLIPGVKKSSW